MSNLKKHKNLNFIILGILIAAFQFALSEKKEVVQIEIEYLNKKNYFDTEYFLAQEFQSKYDFKLGLAKNKFARIGIITTDLRNLEKIKNHINKANNTIINALNERQRELDSLPYDNFNDNLKKLKFNYFISRNQNDVLKINNVKIQARYVFNPYNIFKNELTQPKTFDKDKIEITKTVDNNIFYFKLFSFIIFYFFMIKFIYMSFVFFKKINNYKKFVLVLKKTLNKNS